MIRYLSKRCGEAALTPWEKQMKRITILSAFALILMMSTASTVDAKDLTVNDGFNKANWNHWNQYGNIQYMAIDYYSTNGVSPSYCVAMRSSTNINGGLEQSIYVMQGVTYTVTADFAYSNC